MYIHRYIRYLLMVLQYFLPRRQAIETPISKPVGTTRHSDSSILWKQSKHHSDRRLHDSKCERLRFIIPAPRNGEKTKAAQTPGQRFHQRDSGSSKKSDRPATPRPRAVARNATRRSNNRKRKEKTLEKEMRPL